MALAAVGPVVAWFCARPVARSSQGERLGSKPPDDPFISAARAASGSEPENVRAIADRPKIKIAAIVRRLMREAEAVANAPRRPATADGEMHGRRAGCT